MIVIFFYFEFYFFFVFFFFFSSRRRHTRCLSDWSSDVCSSDLRLEANLRRQRGGNVLLLPGSCAADARSKLRSDHQHCFCCGQGRQSERICIRSEERRVGKECRCQGWQEQEKKKIKRRK